MLVWFVQLLAGVQAIDPVVSSTNMTSESATSKHASQFTVIVRADMPNIFITVVGTRTEAVPAT